MTATTMITALMTTPSLTSHWMTTYQLYPYPLKAMKLKHATQLRLALLTIPLNHVDQRGCANHARDNFSTASLNGGVQFFNVFIEWKCPRVGANTL
jgi:hypothetical protein